MKNVVIIPEPHLWDKTFKNRADYPEEVYGYLAEVVSRIEAMEGEKNVIFPGDVFHRAYTSVGGMTKAISFFSELNRITNNNVYSCVGNHELSFQNGNPFWMLAHDSTSSFKQMQGLDAYGAMSPGIRIVDELAVGPLNFIFGHYGRTDFSRCDTSRDCVLITHNSLLEDTIDETVNKIHGTESAAQYFNTSPLLSGSSIPITEALKYVFVGHMHTYYSSFDVDELVGDTKLVFLLQYMGSLGRTSITEINDRDLERTIPVFRIDEDTYEYSSFTIQLKARAEIVREEVVAESQQKYTFDKAVKELRKSNVFGETPLECIERHLQDTPGMLTLFSRVYHNEIDGEIQNLLKEAQQYDGT